ncbi:EAL and modified HD-GYP domain-containing signal transduction protein [Halolactibacillus halophilus]|uniref:EAL and modified HD-GYP domain-containing signal transduction protein n=1 Tax=Halolactibacillus halophilus TaxID=306540 RepID=A0A1I5PDA5_9BACI|nr:HDOD domain-containing protein [Halolactibacillus halophilus]GEM02947.1 hypothetical protein HHA03_24790 [Halolactibacillus halophilus]SFP31466.1 EAL and modified HD-GYP domain-containing signal transduction protein [Halolactibacillus halophilus]
MSKALVAKQPILDRQRKLYAYELLYRSDRVNQMWDGDKATVEVVINAFLNIGIDQIAGHYPVFVNFTETLLLSERFDDVASQNIVIEILEDVELTPKMIAKIKYLKRQGYRLALDDVTQPLYNKWVKAGVIHCLTYLKVDFLTTTRLDQERIINDMRLHYPSVSLIAEKVETMDDFDFAKRIGYHLFQGFFFMEPEILETFEIPAYYLSYLNLVKEIERSDVELLTLAKTIQKDLSLSYKLLKLINSPAYRRVQKINSIERAVVLLGQQELKKWLYILALRDMSQKQDMVYVEPLIKSSYYRAKMCENLAEKLLPNQTQEAFLVGYFSQLPAILRQPMDQLLQALSLNDTIETALSEGQSQLSDFLRLAVGYEQVDWEAIDVLTKQLNLTEAVVQTCYQEANDWVQTLFQAH